MTRGFVGLAALVAVVVTASASAEVTQRAQVGVSGRNATHGYPAALYVVVKSPPDYQADCCSYDGDGASWKGPPYGAVKKPSFGGDTELGWSAHFDTKASNAESADRESFTFKSWPDVSKNSVNVPHTVHGRQIGTIAGVAVIARSPGSTSAAYEGAVGFPLCRGLFVAVYFSTTKPLNDDTGIYGKYLVKGTVVSTWNLQQLQTALTGVSLDGNLPAGRITAHAAGRVVTGVVTDCVGHRMPSVVVRGAGASTRTGVGGAYRLAARRAGVVRIVAVGGGRTVRSSPIRLR
jgi:hypothetical protein